MWCARTTVCCCTLPRGVRVVAGALAAFAIAIVGADIAYCAGFGGAAAPDPGWDTGLCIARRLLLDADALYHARTAADYAIPIAAAGAYVFAEILWWSCRRRARAEPAPRTPSRQRAYAPV